MWYAYFLLVVQPDLTSPFGDAFSAGLGSISCVRTAACVPNATAGVRWPQWVAVNQTAKAAQGTASLCLLCCLFLCLCTGSPVVRVDSLWTPPPVSAAEFPPPQCATCGIANPLLVRAIPIPDTPRSVPSLELKEMRLGNGQCQCQCRSVNRQRYKSGSHSSRCGFLLIGTRTENYPRSQFQSGPS